MYCLPGWPSASSHLTAPITKLHQSKSAKPVRHVTILAKDDLKTNEFLQPSERERLVRTHSADKPQGKIFLS